MRPSNDKLACGLVALCLVAACGEDEEPTPGPCEAQGLEVMGLVSDIDATVTAPNTTGTLDSLGITLNLGEIEYTPAGGEPDMRPMLMTLQTNVSSPEGRELLLALDQRVNEEGMDSFTIVRKDITEYCDVRAGELCARFGLDDTRNGKLINDAVIHAGTSGTVTVKQLTSSRLEVHWDVAFGPNLMNAFDESSGAVSGCFAAEYGQPRDNVYTLE